MFRIAGVPPAPLEDMDHDGFFYRPFAVLSQDVGVVAGRITSIIKSWLEKGSGEPVRVQV